MASPDAAQPGGRETRLLLVTIAISVGVLLLLSQFRFPEHTAEPLATPAAAPLDRLAARAAYDDLSSTMADLERRLAAAVVVLPVQPHRDSGGFVVAPRLSTDRAVTILRPDETLPGDSAGASRIISIDLARDLAVVAVPGDPSAIVVPRYGPLRPGPRYVVAVEGSPDGLTLRPVYIGRSSMRQDPRTSTPLLTLSGVQHPIPRGAALFSLDGIFLGLVIDTGATTTVVPGDFLRERAETAAVATETTGRLGVHVDALTEPLKRATAASRGVVVTAVDDTGPAADLLAPGDVIQAIDDSPVPDIGAFRRLERSRAPGQAVAVSIVRRREVESVTVKAADARASSATRTVDAPGIIGRTAEGAGIEVVSVQRSSPAERAGLLRGDVIATIDGRPADDLANFVRAFRTAPPGAAWVLTVQRGQQAHALALEKR